MVKEDIIAYSELIEILQYVSANNYYKIPKKERDFYYKNADADYYFRYNPQKTLEENNVSEKTKKLLAYIFKKYWATEIQKEKIKNYDKAYYEKIEKEKREKYNPDTIFNKNETISNDESVKEDVDAKNLPIQIEKENIIKRIFSYIFKFFNKKYN